jgi:hypothetical protein
MRETTTPPSYAELLRTFIAVLNHALRQGELSPTCSTFDLSVTQAIGNVARAAHDGSPTHELTDKACKAFAKYAAHKKRPNANSQCPSSSKPGYPRPGG